MDDQNIQILIRQTKTKISKARTSRKIRQILNALGYDHHEISVLITGDDDIRSMNSQYRGIDKPTNVLAFPMLEGDFPDLSPDLLGDVAISVDTALREALEAGISLEERLSQLLIHGILHLVGFDHETGEDDAADMESKSLEILRIIESNPSLDAF